MSGNAWKRPLSLCSLLLLVSILSLLNSCDNDDDHRATVLPTPTVLNVGQPATHSVAFNGFNAYSAAVTPGTVYKISMTEPADDTDLLYFGGDASFSAQAACAVDNTAITGNSPEDCIVASPGGILYFAVDGAYQSASEANYTIAVEQVSVTTMSSTVPVLDSTPRTGTKIYAVPVTAGAPVLAAITGLNADGDLHIFQDDKLSAAASCTTDNTRFSGSTPEDCRFTPGVLTAYLVVDSIFSETPTLLYTAFTTTAPTVESPVTEGTSGSPKPLSLHSPALGQVAFNGTSFYAVPGVMAGNRYTISISGLTANADLTAYTTSSFNSPAACLIDNISYAGTTPESCTLVAAGSSLYFKVTANTTSGGAAFITLIEPGP